MKILLTASILMSALAVQAQTTASLTSPNGKIKVEVNADKELVYTVIDNGNTLLTNTIGIDIAGAKSSKFFATKDMKSTKESITAPNYKLATFTSEYNTYIINNKNGVNVEFRIFNDGVAYRYNTSSTKGEWKVNKEKAELAFSGDYTSYLPYSTNEKNPKAMAFQATYDVAPLSQTSSLDAFLPVTVDCKTAKVTLLETDVEGYPGMFVHGGNGTTLSADFAAYPKTFDHYPWRQQRYVTANEEYIAKGKGNRTFPWRILAITHNDAEMPVNTLAYSLASPSRIKGDTSWIKPGKVAWDWWNDWAISGVDFEVGINQDTYKYYIDFASKNHLEYVILDEGWYNPKSGDMLTTIPEINLPELVSYAKQKNVGIILWCVFNVLDDQLDAACKKYSEMGIKGFKVDFLDRYDQEGVDMIYRIAQRCADFHLILDYHGIFAPQGIQRTYPNVVNFEACFGMEEVKWTAREKGTDAKGKSYDRPSKDMPLYDVTFPFIRGMAGYVDFTPGGMRNATASDFQPIYHNPLTMGTRCHQLAHYIVHDSPLTMLADNPTIYMQEQECTDFLSSLPAVYDEMKILDAKMGEYIVTARRKGNDWYVAAETNWQARDITLSAQFLTPGTYSITAFLDGKNADKTATDYQIRHYTFPLSGSPQESITLHLAPGGGFAAKLIKQ